MNIHVSKEIKHKYPTYEFKGKPHYKDGKKYIRAYHKILKQTLYYCFEEDFFGLEINLSGLWCKWIKHRSL